MADGRDYNNTNNNLRDRDNVAIENDPKYKDILTNLRKEFNNKFEQEHGSNREEWTQEVKDNFLKGFREYEDAPEYRKGGSTSNTIYDDAKRIFGERKGNYSKTNQGGSSKSSPSTPSKKPNYFEVLGKDKNASLADLNKAYRAKAQELHPDVNKSPDAEARFKELNEAASSLGLGIGKVTEEKEREFQIKRDRYMRQLETMNTPTTSQSGTGQNTSGIKKAEAPDGFIVPEGYDFAEPVGELGEGAPQLGSGVPELGAGLSALDSGTFETPQLGESTPQLGSGISSMASDAVGDQAKKKFTNVVAKKATRKTIEKTAGKATKQVASAFTKQVANKVGQEAAARIATTAATVAAAASSMGTSLAIQAGLFAISKSKEIFKGMVALGTVVPNLFAGMSISAGAPLTNAAIAFVITPIVLATFVIIINTGAYVVPSEGGFQCTTGDMKGLGIFTNGGGDAFKYVSEATPNMVVLLDNFDFADKIATDTLIVGRSTAEFPDSIGDANVKDKLVKLMRENPKIDVWQGYNEALSKGKDFAWLTQHDLASIEAAKETGSGICLGNFKEGWPKVPTSVEFKTYAKTVTDAAVAAGVNAYLCVHEHENATSNSGTWTFGNRYNGRFKQLVAGGMKLPVLVTVAGYDSQAGPDVDAGTGWKGTITPEVYKEMLISYQGAAMAAGARGVAVFQLGLGGSWDSFDITELMEAEQICANISTQFGTTGTYECLNFTGPWPDAALNTEMQAAEIMLQDTRYKETLCSDGSIDIIYNPQQAVYRGIEYGGEVVSRGKAVQIYGKGTGSLGNTLYTLSHELGHIFDHRTGASGTMSRSALVAAEWPICTYPFQPAPVIESFAESIALYIAGPRPESGYRNLACIGGTFKTRYNDSWAYLRDRIFSSDLRW